jgi:hypothetical protein
MPHDAEPVEGTGMLVPYTRVSTILDTHKNKEGISKWRARHIVKGIGDREDLVALAAATRLSDKTNLDRIAEQAFDYAEGQAAANRGSALHGFLERWFEGDKTLVIPERWRPDVSAVVSKFEQLGIRVIPEHQEMVIVRPDLSDGNSEGLAGRVDLVLGVQNDDFSAEELVVADYKTGKNPLEYGAWEIQQQGGTYGSGWAVWDGQFWRPMPKIRRDYMLMVHVVPGQAEVTVHRIDIDPDEIEADLAAAYRTRARVKAAKKAHRELAPAPRAPFSPIQGMSPVAAAVSMVLSEQGDGLEQSVDILDKPAFGIKPTLTFAPTPAAPTPDAADQIRIRDARLEKLSEVMGAAPDDDGGSTPYKIRLENLAPMAGPGKRGCGACGRTGHRRGSDVCLGDRDPGKVVDVPVPVADPVPTTPNPCAHGQWTRNPVSGAWHCGLDDCDAVASPEQSRKMTAEHDRRVDLASVLSSKVEVPVAEPVAEVDPFGDDERLAADADRALFLSRIDQAKDKATLRDIRDEATEINVWDESLKAAALKRLETINAAG